MDRLLNIVFGLIVIYLFVLVAHTGEHVQILAGLGGAMGLSFFGFVISWLTLDGAQSAFVTGLVAFGLGGIPAAIILLTFFVTGTLLTTTENTTYSDLYGDMQPMRRRRRNGIQVWSNSFWFVLFLVIWFILRDEPFLIAGLAALATAMSDTWATEIGYRLTWGPTYIIKGWRKVQPGTDGGVSVSGVLGGLTGGLLIGILSYVIYPQVGMATGLFIAIIGFIGCQIDSYLGAYFQYEGKKLNMPVIGIRRLSLDNDAVNWAAIGLGSFSSLILIHLLSLS